MELRMYNPEYLERPYIVILNKIDIPKAEDKMSSVTREIMRIGISSGVALQAPSTVKGDSSENSSKESNEERNIKEIEEYMCPLAVVGVSVLSTRVLAGSFSSIDWIS